MTPEHPAPSTSDPIQPISEKTHPIGSGTQRIYRFDNSYGASVIRFNQDSGTGSGLTVHSYGGETGLWELAVLDFSDDESGSITYDTPVADDILGWLDEDAVQATLQKIRALPAKQPTPSTSDDDRRRIIAQVQGAVDAWRDGSVTAEQAMTIIEQIVGGRQS
jgi:hypothetical protein